MNFEGIIDAFIRKLKKKQINEREVVSVQRVPTESGSIGDLCENQGQRRVPFLTFLDLFLFFHSRRALVILKV